MSPMYVTIGYIITDIHQHRKLNVYIIIFGGMCLEEVTYTYTGGTNKSEKNICETHQVVSGAISSSPAGRPTCRS
jgi:hypothetical protein